jgi:hypothetical protein
MGKKWPSTKYLAGFRGKAREIFHGQKRVVANGAARVGESHGAAQTPPSHAALS